MKKKDLEIILQKIPSPLKTNPQHEQYSTPANIAADIIYYAHFYNDIKNKTIVDLGCGTGMFAIASALTGAKHTIGIDIDKNLIHQAQTYNEKKNLNIDFKTADINDITTTADTVFMNPPFGAQKSNQHADRKFLKKAIQIAPIIYSLHLTQTLPFIKTLLTRLHAEITHHKSYNFPIKHQFPFHKKQIKLFDVTMLRIKHYH